MTIATRELKEERAAHQQTMSKLKSERRSAASARQEKDAAVKGKAQAVEDADMSRRKEERIRETASALRRELTELRQAYATVCGDQEHSLAACEATYKTTQRSLAQRDIALQEVSSLAKELEELHVALGSPPHVRRVAFDETPRSRLHEAVASSPLARAEVNLA